uniref:Ig-like domain-containing protein n=1 Tax=Oryzias latipes TaxID=8090 RepID=A0A3P9LWB1_ORYLA
MGNTDMDSSSLRVCLLILTLYPADGFIHYILNRCLFNSSDLKDIENIYSYYYNKEEFLRFSSSSGKFVGYTEFGVKTAELTNNDPEKMSRRRAEKETFCKPNIDNDYSTILTKSVQPRVRVHSLEPSGGNHPAMLICSVYDFYPKKIKVSWLQDQEEVSSDVTSTAEMEDGDWFYQIHSYLEYTPSISRLLLPKGGRTFWVLSLLLSDLLYWSKIRWMGWAESSRVLPVFSGAEVWRENLLQGRTRQLKGSSHH